MLGSNHKIYWATLKSTWKQNGIHGSTRTAERSWVKKIAFLLRVACLRECFWQKMRISFYMFKNNVVWNLSLRANPQKKCGEQSHASTKWSIAKAETMILQDRSGMEGGEQKRLVHLGEDLNHKLVMAGLGSAENECKKPWRQWAKMKKQTWPDPWNNQISQAVPMDYGHWNSSKQKKQFANTSCLIENVSTEQRSAFIKIKWAARLLIPTVSYKAWNQNSVSQQNSLGTRTKIVKQQAFKTCHLLQRSVEPKIGEWFHLQTCGNHWEKRFMPCMPLFMQHRPCMATSKKNSKWLYMSHFPNNYKRKMPQCWFVDNYLVWVVFPWQTKQKIIEQMKARSQAGRHMPLKIKAHISQTKLARPKLARLCMLF